MNRLGRNISERGVESLPSSTSKGSVCDLWSFFWRTQIRNRVQPTYSSVSWDYRAHKGCMHAHLELQKIVLYLLASHWEVTTVALRTRKWIQKKVGDWNLYRFHPKFNIGWILVPSLGINCTKIELHYLLFWRMLKSQTSCSVQKSFTIVLHWHLWVSSIFVG